MWQPYLPPYAVCLRSLDKHSLPGPTLGPETAEKPHVPTAPAQSWVPALQQEILSWDLAKDPEDVCTILGLGWG